MSGQVVDLAAWKAANPLAVYRAIGKKKDEAAKALQQSLWLQIAEFWKDQVRE